MDLSILIDFLLAINYTFLLFCTADHFWWDDGQCKFYVAGCWILLFSFIYSCPSLWHEVQYLTNQFSTSRFVFRRPQGSRIAFTWRQAQSVKHLPAMWETWVQFLDQKFPWRRKWQPTPVFLPGESHGQRSLAGYSSWDLKSQTWLSPIFFYLYSPIPNVWLFWSFHPMSFELRVLATLARMHTISSSVSLVWIPKQNHYNLIFLKANMTSVRKQYNLIYTFSLPVVNLCPQKLYNISSFI